MAAKNEAATGPRWRNWSREQRCRPHSIVRPHTREGLIAAIVEANDAGRQIRASGSGHSFNSSALTDGTMLRLDALDRILKVDHAAQLVKVEAGIELWALNQRLDRLGLALENLGDIDRQTLAGSISTATHGTGARYRNRSAQVTGLELITADGTTLELSEDSDPDGFRAARVGIGALGVIYAVTLRVVPPFRIDRTDRQRPLAETLGRLDELVDSLDHFEFFVFPHADRALCRESTRTDAPARPRGKAGEYAQEVVLENWVGAGFASVARLVPATIPTLSKLATAGAGSSRRLDHSFRVFASERRLKFTEMEYAVPRANAREAIQAALDIANRRELKVAFPIEVRFVAGDDAMLSPAHERDACYIAVHYDRRGGWGPYFSAVAGAMAEFGGRPHWGKRHSLDVGELRKLYPRFEDFRAVRERLDPAGRFANDYTDRVLGPIGAFASESSSLTA
ncbi:MAG: D-arabinono-1,4-lactone oxidase [Solirubrobacterales bacterium]